MKTARSNRSSAFTLVELLIVVGIIAVLIAMLMPVLSKVREQGRQVTCLSNLRQLGQAMIAYAADNDGYLPATARNTMDPIAKNYPSGDWLYWQLDRNPSYGDKEIRHSGLGKYLQLNFTGQDFTVNSGALSVLRCPADDMMNRLAPTMSSSAGTYRFSYVMNWLIASDSSLLYSSNYQGTTPALCTSLRKVTNGSQKVLMYEEDPVSIDDGEGMAWAGCSGTFNPNTDPSTWGSFGQVNLLSLRHEQSKAPADPNADKSMPGSWSQAVPIPDAHGNVVFCDGHADFVTRAYLHRPDHTVGSQY